MRKSARTAGMQPVEEYKKPRMRGPSITVGKGSRGTSCAAFALVAILAACAPIPDPGAGLSVEESVALIDQVQLSDVALETIAETFALDGRSTDVQRENLTAQYPRRQIEWVLSDFRFTRRLSATALLTRNVLGWQTAIPMRQETKRPLVRPHLLTGQCHRGQEFTWADSHVKD